MDFGNSIKQAVEIVKLNGKAAVAVSKDKNATLIGILIIAIGGILSQILSFEIGIMIFTVAVLITGYFIVVGVMHILALLFGGKARYMEYFRAESHAAILSWLGILVMIPFLGGIINILISIWGIVVSVVILENVHKLTRGKAVIVVLIPVIISILLIVIGSIAYFGTLNPEAFGTLSPEALLP